MKQTADEKTPAAAGETEINISQMTSCLNQISAIVVPLVTDSQRLVWVQTNQIELNCEAELVKAFDRFPYLTKKETDKLARRCSLHPDQVRVWFMAQRLRFGVSWDFTDILKVRTKFRSYQGWEELQARPVKEVKADSSKKTRKRKTKEPGGRKVIHELRGEQSTNDGKIIEEKVRDDEQMEGKMKVEQPIKKDGEGEEKKKAQKKRKRMKQVDGEQKKVLREMQTSVQLEARNKRAEEVREPTQTKNQTDSLKREDADLSSFPDIFLTLGELVGAKLEEKQHTRSTNPVTVTEVNDNPTAENHTADISTPPPRSFHSAKNPTQVEILRMAFLSCQYPDRNDYEQLSMLTGLPQSLLVQWFADTRYYIKKGRPKWMSLEQHSQTLANVRYRQYLNMMVKAERLDDKKRMVKMQLSESESCSEEKSVPEP